MEKQRSGQSLAEVLLAVAIGTILITTSVAVIVPALQSNTQATKIQAASSLGKELLDNVRAWSEGGWNNVLALATGTSNMYYLNTTSSPFTPAVGTESITISTSSASSSVNLNSGLVGYWKFDEGTGTTAYDSSGNNNTGQWQGVGQWTSGQVGPSAGQFNGSSYVSASPISLSRFTVSAWVKPNGNQTGSPSIVADMYPSYVNYTIGFDPGTTNVYGGIYNTNWYQTTRATLASNVWSFVLITYDGTNLTLYINGSSINSVPAVTPQSSGTQLRIGRRWDLPDYVNGAIDDVRIYNRALSGAEVSQLYSYALSSNAYTRSFYLSDVYRDGSGNIVTSGGVYDPSTKLVTVVYGWPGGKQYSMATYIVRGRNNVVFQNDWSGGANMTSSVETTTNNQFASSTKIDYSSTTGSISVSIPGY